MKRNEYQALANIIQSPFNRIECGLYSFKRTHKHQGLRGAVYICKHLLYLIFNYVWKKSAKKDSINKTRLKK